MVRFDIDDRYLDDNVVGHAISRRDGVFASVVFHIVLFGAILYGPQIPFFQLSPEEIERRRAALREQMEQQRQFVFVQPRIDLQALEPREQAPLSDADRLAQAPEEALRPENPLPLAQGNSPERVEEEPSERARGDEAEPTPPQPETQIARAEPTVDLGLPRRQPTPPPRAAGSLGEALRNLQRYVENQTFDNPKGGNDRPGATIQFDSKGVEFGPWLRRFVAQVRRNWFIPQAAYVMSGPRGAAVQRPQGRPHYGRGRGRALVDRRVQQRRVRRHRLVQPHRAAAAGVPVGHGVLHGNFSL